MQIEEDTVVDDLMREIPATIRVFLAHQMHCVGCPIASFHTIGDACREHAVEIEGFLADLRSVSRDAQADTERKEFYSAAAQRPVPSLSITRR